MAELLKTYCKTCVFIVIYIYKRVRGDLPMHAIIWLILFVVLVIFEIVTMGLTTIWFAAGALVAFIAACDMVGTVRSVHYCVTGHADFYQTVCSEVY